MTAIDLTDIPLVDNHCHGILRRQPVGPPRGVSGLPSRVIRVCNASTYRQRCCTAV